ncbi:TIGR03943 family putative permease subunit [Kitasatospora sp. NPDC018058]|uniref:TIGR03943 family putative permease subunit n=1 Tax=Kitasatospora sp. NPDC018058 TaxID=3364025 RepID=UPI0037BF53C4
MKATVRELVPSLLVALVGIALLRITVNSDLFLQYVKEGLRYPLIGSGLVLLGLGITGAARRLTARRREPVMRFGRDTDGNAVWLEPSAEEQDHEHEHHHSPGIAWLLTVPAVLLLCFTPPALGSFTASRDGADATVEKTDYAALAPQASAVEVPTPMSLTEFIGRSRDPEGGLKDHKVRLTGFVTPGPNPDEWYLNRLVVSCCAADARRLRVLVHAPGPTPAADSWVALTGVWTPVPGAANGTPPRIETTEQHAVPQPRAPYRDLPPSES